ncbi:MAG: TetR/AcrR family transcriptional regulator [Alphaproteobacteria bacterium]|nr:TetR/AcrR family transcriptional regulator [Alphaproteobacteria bacterium]MBU1514696.1 TetR/AcrR family transcriptional regulator [Alphaproteobacteria bacterium]MBU2093555.1 TetR/AcrR family transcriptional regulator [Alphaproteobacteria bacterium]MBU2149469.1 TetR/AcrR family transcriptional regulator [Alphaproteobacteria bacterium]MBU2305488.1 TetR/AcrR family transcriptional regulator [Alphaproteobacteria bacterium]
MARPRTVTDAAILEAALGVMRRDGPAAVTFAAVAQAVGLAPATLVQRYPNKEALLRAALLRAWDHLDALTAAADASEAIDPEGAIAMLVRMFPASLGDQDYAEGLLILREDMRDPVLRARGVAWGEVLAGALGRRLTKDPHAQMRLGRLMASQWQGAQIWWAFSRADDPAVTIARELREWCAIVLGRP